MEFGKSDHFLSWMGDIKRHSPPVVCVLIIVIKQIQIDIQVAAKLWPHGIPGLTDRGAACPFI